MVDNGGDAGADDAALENLGDGSGDRQIPKWVKSGTWCCATLLGLPVVYFFVYPALAMFIYKALGEPQPVPSLLDRSIAPIEWVGERNDTYENYTSWLGNLLL